MIVKRILGSTPVFELSARGLYYSNSRIINSISRSVSCKMKQRRSPDIKAPSINDGFKIIDDYISTLGIKQGDLLIVHSSSDELLKLGLNPNEVLFYLRDLIGREGTLAIPCFPLYNKRNYDPSRKLFVYSPKRTLCSTGLIPNLFLRKSDVIRSFFPWNSLAAQGPLASGMMKGNLNTDLAHGKGSAWEYCMRHNAKILLLGTRSCRSTTMVHVAEDIMDEEWPISNWYETRSFLIKNNSSERQMEIRIRKPEWARYNASLYRSAQFEKMGILREKQIAGISVGFIEDSRRMVDYVIERTNERKPFFVVPKRCYKK
ncbi:MAG: AAC(3) family N-acetyltransferase [Eggerthellaceae bacterium]|nr:AAC(3) family N-acetyltransferase [Eggerthellaceae bacterium]